MANIPETPEWSPEILRIEETDKVLGGENGVVNQQAQQLANRTALLKQQVEGAAQLAAQADGKADDALGQIATIEAAAGSATAAAGAAEQHRLAAETSAALAGQSQQNAASDAAQAYNNATYAVQAAGTAQGKAAEASTSATVAQGAANLAVGARDVAIGARDAAVAASDAAVVAKSEAELIVEGADAARDEAVSARDEVVAAKTEIRNWYYGPLAADPATRPDGSATQEGDEYHNTVTGDRMVYSGGAWGAVLGKLAADLANAADPSKGAAQVARAQQAVGSIAELRGLKSGSSSKYAEVFGYYSRGDGGGGLYYLDAADTTSPDNGGTVIVANDGGRWKLNHTGILAVTQFGARGDGVTDDAGAIQSAFDAIGDGQSLVFPPVAKFATDTVFLVGSPLNLARNDVKLYAPPRAEYGVSIKGGMSAAEVLRVTGFGCAFHNLVFEGDGTASAYATISGLVFDRSSLGDAETYANLDHEVVGCGFLNLLTCVRGRGRNVLVRDCTVSNSKFGVVGEVFTYGAGIDAGLRGWRVLGNRFHSMGNPSYAGYSADTDSWCVVMPSLSANVAHIEVCNNNADLGMGFYKGQLTCSRVSGNIYYNAAGPLVDSGNAPSERNNAFVSSVDNNVWFGVATSGAIATHAEPDHAIRIVAHSNIHISGNSLRRSAKELIALGTPSARAPNCVVSGNLLVDGNYSYLRVGDFPAVSACLASRCSVSDNTIRSSVAPVSYSYGIAVDKSDANGQMRLSGNSVQPGRAGELSFSGSNSLNGLHLGDDNVLHLLTRSSSDSVVSCTKQDESGNPAETFAKVVFKQQSGAVGSEKMDLEFWSMQNGTLTKQGYFHWGGGFVLPPRATAILSPPAGCLACADGVSWNPGSGAGLYRYTGTAWVFVG